MVFIEKSFFLDGLGQLTDGIFGSDDYRSTDQNRRGYDWIGWKRNTSINLLFYFDTSRNFTGVRIHTSNLFTQQIHLFPSIRIASCEKLNTQSMSMDFIIPSDSLNTSSRLIQILLTKRKHFITNCLNLTINQHETSQWILISEIEFDSLPINSTFLILNSNLFIHYWHWLFFLLTLILFALILLLIHRIQAASSSSSSPIGKIPCLTKIQSGNDIRHHLIVSTASSDVTSTINPYLTATTTNPYSSVDMYIDSNQKSIQGLCGNSTYECTNLLDKIPSIVTPCWKNEQIIIGQNYSKPKGEFGIVS